VSCCRDIALRGTHHLSFAAVCSSTMPSRLRPLRLQSAHPVDMRFCELPFVRTEARYSRSDITLTLRSYFIREHGHARIRHIFRLSKYAAQRQQSARTRQRQLHIIRMFAADTAHASFRLPHSRLAKMASIGDKILRACSPLRPSTVCGTRLPSETNDCAGCPIPC